MHTQIITQARLKELLDYCPDTGVFTWKPRDTRGFNMSGKEAGNQQKEGYRVIRVDGKLYKEHRVAWLYVNGLLPPYPDYEIDHIDQNPSNNHISNLRIVTHKVNGGNQKMRSTNSSGHMGVGWRPTNMKWQARINVGGKRISLGLFFTYEEAVIARKEAEIKYGYTGNHGGLT